MGARRVVGAFVVLSSVWPLGLGAQAQKPAAGGGASVAPTARVTSIDPSRRLKGFERYQALTASSPFKDLRYLGTDTGVYVTTDGGTSWVTLGSNLPAVYGHDLIVHPRDNVVVIATHGRGMWLIDADPINHESTRRRAVEE
jgi:hypothetical protein